MDWELPCSKKFSGVKTKMKPRMKLPDLELGQEVWISKDVMTHVPLGFEETWMGEMKGALKQYRGPGNLHLLEFPNGWKLHSDYGDPRNPEGFLIHIFVDAPEVGVSLLYAIGEAFEKYRQTKSIADALLTFASKGVLAYLSLKILKELLLWLTRVLING